jgi:hypothetical protein
MQSTCAVSIAIGGLSGPTAFFHTITLEARFSEKIVIQNKICVLNFSTNFW